jgi:type II secretory ATPase GspE/PulE/Tfp pilus assembly ATPase PilB-like protein
MSGPARSAMSQSPNANSSWSGESPDPAAVFCWPTPPFAVYPPSSPQLEHEACEFEGLNGKVMKGRLTFFEPAQSLAQLQVPPSRTTIPLRFNQFRSMTLTRPCAPLSAASQADPSSHSPVLSHPDPLEYRVMFNTGEAIEGLTLGHVELDFGLFLFPPQDEVGTVHRLFVPREAYTSYEMGPRIGELLVASRALTAAQVEQAVEVQHHMRAQKLGDILLTKQVVTPEQLLVAIDQQARMPMVRIGEALTALGLISMPQLEDALSQQQQDRNVPLGELLIRLGLVSRQDLQTALARKMGYPLVDLQKFPIDPDALRKVPFSMAARLEALPLLIREGTLIIALEDPSDRRVLSELEFTAQCKIAPVLAQHGKLDVALREAYVRIGADTSVHLFSKVPSQPLPLDLEPDDTNTLVASLEKEGNEELGLDDKPIEQSDNSLVRLINTMIIEAHQQGVSDIHIESYPGREKIKIRFRKDGALLPYLELPHNYRSALIARIKIMCDLDISERRKPQDGKINFAKFVAQHKIELRVASIPTNNGMEDVVMRILTSAKPLPLDKIGLSPWNLEKLREAMERPYGLVLCVGPTGSGKTTTLHSALSFINVPERKIWTAEDPVEITQPGLRQVQVNPKIDWTFAKALRAFLRADPDVIMVGEMRDAETASMGIEASLTGHLVLSTLHTNSAPETVTRLLDMGMDPFNFADSLLVVLAQRLVRRLCTTCKISEAAPPEYVEELLDDYLHNCPKDDPQFDREALRARWVEQFGQDGHLLRYRHVGCPSCNQMGFKGRAGIHELMTVTRALRRLIQTGTRAEELQRQGLSDGMRTLRHDGIEKVLAGVTTMEEVRATSNV